MRYALMLVAVGVLGLTVPAIAADDTSRTQAPPSPTVRPAIDGVLAAFASHPLVGLAEYHGGAQEEDFYAALVRDPRFAHEVGNVVVEFGGAARQQTIDRYVDGEDVPYKELRAVWTDTVGWIPTVTSLGYMNFYAQIRAVNAGLPAGQRIHVWLGDPPIDWSKVKTRADLESLGGQRDSYPAGIINEQILDKKAKALVIYGIGHFYGPRALRQLVEEVHPHSFFVVQPYFGFNEKSCAAEFERDIGAWPTPALASPVRGTTLERKLAPTGCTHMAPGTYFFPPGTSEEQKAKAISAMEEEASAVAADGLLYLGPAASLTRSPISPDIYLDLEYRREIERRTQIRGMPLSRGLTASANTLSPRYERP